MNSILKSDNIPEEVLLTCFSVAKHWAGYSTKSLVVDEPLVLTMFQVMERLPSLAVFKKAVNVLRNILTKSNLCKALTNVNFADIVSGNAIP